MGDPSPSSSMPTLSGNIPGLVDPAQPARILRSPHSILNFASFDPRTALPVASSDFTHPTHSDDQDDSCRPKRIVIETLPSGEATWRFVPKARLDPNVSNEGTWPRIIELCGEHILCTQSQWEIYKLDPAYDCFVRSPPALTVISRAAPRTAQVPPSAPNGKHRMSLSPDTPDDLPRKRPQVYELHSDDEGAKTENGMDIDDPPLPPPPMARRQTKLEREQTRKDRREKAARRIEKLGGESGNQSFNFEKASESSHQEPLKRKASTVFDGVRLDGTPSPTDDPLRSFNFPSGNPTFKKFRQGDPDAARKAVDARRAERQRKKRERHEQELQARRAQRQNAFMSEIYASMPANGTNSTTSPDTEEENQPPSPPSEDIDQEEAARLAVIEESRRKLAELEKDRPLWEAEARKREARELAENQARSDARVRKEAATQAKQQAKQREAEEERRKAQEARLAHEQATRREREKQRVFQRQWTVGPWNTRRALDRFRTLAEVFDDMKYSSSIPLTFEAVPWPVLNAPFTYSVEDIDWNTVETFFEAVKPLLRTQDYKALVERTQRRMHPDRWRSRNLLKSVLDDEERGCMEVAANTVSQAVTPIWIRAKKGL